jgi:uncharacterized tellurite resistance protein B-like protein
MLKRIADLLGTAKADSDSGSSAFDEVQLAVATLLVEAASMDSDFDQQERATITDLLDRRFELGADRAASLVAAGEAKAQDNAELYRLSRTIKEAFAHEDRVELMQMLWEVAYADGELHSFEASLMRRLAGLVYVSDRENGEARKRAQARLGLSNGPGGER